MGSALLRDKISIADNGDSQFQNYDHPTLTIGGTKDGFNRVSRVAESYWHQVKNINKAQKNLFPVVELEGVSHAQFASDDYISDTVYKGDLNPDVSFAEAHSLVGAAMAQWISKVIKFEATTTDSATANLLAPMVLAMEQEGYAQLKPPCNVDPLIAPESDICFSGCPWVEANVLNQWIDYSEPGWNPNITVRNDDSFHPASEVYPYHHPEVDGKCAADVSSPCEVVHISVTEAAYGNSSEDKLSKKSISAYELRTKIKSNQFIHEKAGMPDASFDYYDLQGDECAQINQSVLQWALDNASDAAVQRYNEIGTQMVFGADKESINGGAWIPDPMTYKTDKASNTMTLTSKILTTDHHEPVVMFRDMHYCKVLSPFRAMEWIYVDSLYVKDSLTSTTNETQALFL